MAEIRTMTIGDYDGVYDLWLNTPGMGINGTDDSREGIEKYIVRNPTTSFVAVDDGKIVGVIMAGHDGRRGFIHHTAVLPAYRGRGIATKLLDSTLDALRAEGIKKVALLTFRKNELGNAFWEASGFKIRNDLLYRNREIAEIEYLPNIYKDENN
jgi:ribosomal protein S18 acetylase RimI-like enzyme